MHRQVLYPVNLILLLASLTFQFGTSTFIPWHTVPTTCADDAQSYDFIIVGGGTAGLALGSRLSQYLPNDCILILEAGPDARNDSNINIPGLRGMNLGSKYDWNFTTVPQVHALNRRVPQARGKVLGGSSAINLMAWDRGSKEDYDSWETLGNPGWNWASMLPAMLRAENFTPDTDKYSTEGVSQGGPVQTLINRYIPDGQRPFFNVSDRLGVPLNVESLDGNPLGAIWHISNIRTSNYTRSYSVEYLKSAGPNLRIMTNSSVARVLLKHETATGVELVDGQIFKARKEVIISGGTYASPSILERSGIGNTSILAAAGIAQVLNLPGVGQNLQDHLRIANSYQLKPQYTSIDKLKYNQTFAAIQRDLYAHQLPSIYDYTGSAFAYLKWDQVAGAPLSNLTSLARAAASQHPSPISQIKASHINTINNVPELEVITSDGYLGIKGYPPIGDPLYGEDFFTFIAGIQHPFQSGSVHINTTDIHGKPVINPNYLSTDYDVQAVITASKYMRRIATTPPYSDIFVSEYEPGMQVQSEKDWELYIRKATMTVYHPLGTCAMMPRDMGGVVDPQLKVYGINNLRVVDASIIPILISGHIQTAVYGIAERAAEMIASV